MDFVMDGVCYGITGSFKDALVCKINAVELCD